MTLPRWAREPLVHFLALGAIIYIALTWGGTPVDPASRVITVGEADQARLALSFERVMGRAPTDAELDAAIEKYVRDEVLFREALRLGLDQGDPVVRQRMVAKMDMSATAAAETAEPDEATLRAYYRNNAARYAGGQSLSFEQEFFTERAEAQAALEGPVEGDPISLPAAVEGKGVREVRAVFGEQFANALAQIEPGENWQGPIRSGFGWHLVRLTERTPVPVAFADIRERVENDWRRAELEARKARAFDILREAYRVEIDR